MLKLISDFSDKIKLLLLIFGISLLLLLFFVFKDAGGVDYYGNYYEAGSLIAPNEYSYSGLGASFDSEYYGSLASTFSGDPAELNQQLGSMRLQNMIYVVIFGIGAIASGWLLLREDEFMGLLMNGKREQT